MKSFDYSKNKHYQNKKMR